MITAKDFTKAEPGIMPPESGAYILLLQSATNAKFYYALAMYHPKRNPENFEIYADVQDQYAVIGWLQIDRSADLANELLKANG